MDIFVEYMKPKQKKVNFLRFQEDACLMFKTINQSFWVAQIFHDILSNYSNFAIPCPHKPVICLEIHFS